MDDEINHDDVDEVIEMLLDLGLLIEHIAEDGEKLYEISPDAKEHAPELWEANADEVKRVIYELFMKGMVTIEFSDDGPLFDKVALTDLAADAAEVEKLEWHQKKYLEHLIKVFGHTDSD